MTSYTDVNVRISESQIDKFKKAFKSNCESITIRLMFTDLHGEDVIAITKLDRPMKAYDINANYALYAVTQILIFKFKS